MRATNYFAAIAARLLFMLGANISKVGVGSQSDRAVKRHQALRNLFWICYSLDKDICLRTGVASAILGRRRRLTFHPVHQASHLQLQTKIVTCLFRQATQSEPSVTRRTRNPLLLSRSFHLIYDSASSSLEYTVLCTR
jgi:hypothetical protein